MAKHPTIRWVQTHEGPKIQNLMQRCQVTDLLTTLDWSQPMGPYWLVTGPDEAFEGAINVAYSQPIGRVEYLLMDPALSKRTRAIMAKTLCYAAFSVCEKLGMQVTGSYICEHETSWQTIAQHHRCVPIETGTYFLRKV